MRYLPAAILLALACSGCIEPRPTQMLSDDLEPAVTQMTMGRSGGDRDPDVSRDGRLLFFASTSHGAGADLYVKSVGSNTATRLTTGLGDKRFPRVSPTQPRSIAYCSNERGSWELCLIPDYVEAPSRSVILSDPGTDNLHPSWSPDGKKIVYCSTHERAGGEWVLKIKDLGTGKTTVLEDADGVLPDWSPAGDRIVFQRMKRRDDWLSSIWTLDLDNGAARNITSVFSSDDWAAINPAWSPDGRRIVFATVGKSRARAGVMTEADDLWVVGADGLNATRLTTNAAADWMPCWALDRIYFVSDRSGSPRIWSLQAP
jgi:TolB protein